MGILGLLNLMKQQLKGFHCHGLIWLRHTGKGRVKIFTHIRIVEAYQRRAAGNLNPHLLQNPEKL